MTRYRLYPIGDCETAIIVDDRPGGLGARVYAVGARTIAGLPRAFYKHRGNIDFVNSVDPVTIGVFSGNAESAVTQIFGMAGVDRSWQERRCRFCLYRDRSCPRE